MTKDDSTFLNQSNATERSLDKLFNFEQEEDYNSKTELTRNQIIDMARATAVAQLFNMPFLGTFVKSYKTHLISLDRQGRKEVVNSVMADINREENKNKSFFEKMTDKLRGV